MTTPSDSTTEQFWFTTHRSFFEFEVRGNEDAKIALHTGTEFEYEVILGAAYNHETKIQRKDGTGTPEFVSTPNILSRDSYRTFWVDTSGQSIKVGRGNLYEEQILEMSVPSVTLRGIAVHSAGASIQWRFSQQYGMSRYNLFNNTSCLNS